MENADFTERPSDDGERVSAARLTSAELSRSQPRFGTSEAHSGNALGSAPGTFTILFPPSSSSSVPLLRQSVLHPALKHPPRVQ